MTDPYVQCVHEVVLGERPFNAMIQESARLLILGRDVTSVWMNPVDAAHDRGGIERADFNCSTRAKCVILATGTPPLHEDPNVPKGIAFFHTDARPNPSAAR